MYVPKINDFEKAIRIYYENIELSSKDIFELFGKVGNQTVVKLKKAAKEKMIEKGTPSWDANRVNTKVAFEAWGLNIKDLEYRYRKLKALNQKGA